MARGRGFRASPEVEWLAFDVQIWHGWTRFVSGAIDFSKSNSDE
jgi:hypothetical protein